VAGTTPVVFLPTLNTGTIGTISQVVTLNYNVPVGNGYRLVATDGLVSANNTLGNSTAVITYPTAGSLILRGNVAALNDAVNTTGNTTNCFHNLTFDEICESTTRTAVIATVGCSSVVNLKLFIEGYYAGSSTMTPVKANQGVGSSATDVDDITVELRDGSNALMATTTASLQTNGDATATFTSGPTGSYYIVVKHRNAIDTWSATTQSVSTSTPLTYDFSNAASKAYGSNMVLLSAGVYGFYSGDLNDDGSIDSSDFPDLFNDSDNLIEGYYATDLNGDGFVDSSDFPVLFNNNDNLISVVSPF
jgi:hypothetical protein